VWGVCLDQENKKMHQDLMFGHCWFFACTSEQLLTIDVEAKELNGDEMYF
jgi:hypothetical protein